MKTPCLLFSLSLLLLAGCTDRVRQIASKSLPLPVSVDSQVVTSPTPTPEPDPSPDETYPGVDISDEFPQLEYGSTLEPNRLETKRSGQHVVKVGRARLSFVDYTPTSVSIGNNSAEIQTRHPGEYWGYAVGKGDFLGKGSEVVYIYIDGPGVVCCNQTILIDVSRPIPRVIFRSEDDGGFKWGTEIFDAEGDGVFELVKWDTSFRYFMDDCGSCSPEPKAVFKYDKRLGKYIPAKGLRQDFEAENLKQDEERIKKQFALWKSGSPEMSYDLGRSVKAHVVDLLWTGEEEKAWQFFELYAPFDKDEVKKAMKAQLRSCDYYQAIRNFD